MIRTLDEPHGLFVYGTLRPLARSGVPYEHPLVPDDAEWVRAAVHGRLWHVSGGGYPVLTVYDAEPDDVVVGEIFVGADPHDPEWASVTRMEIGAGYRIGVVRVAESVGGGTAWCYVYPPGRRHGPRIASGDWRRPRRVSHPHGRVDLGR